MHRNKATSSIYDYQLKHLLIAHLELSYALSLLITADLDQILGPLAFKASDHNELMDVPRPLTLSSDPLPWGRGLGLLCS